MIQIYLGVCCLNRPFDNQAQARIRLEAEAVLIVLTRCETGTGSGSGVRYSIGKSGRRLIQNADDGCSP